MKRYQWIASTKRRDGHAGETIFEDGSEDDASRAIELAQEAATRLRSSGATGWYVGVQDLQSGTISNNPPTIGFRLLFLDEG